MIKRVVTRANCLIFFGPELCQFGPLCPYNADVLSPEPRVHDCCARISPGRHFRGGNPADHATIHEAVSF